MNFNQFLLFDGAMGTELQKRGLKAGTLPELMNLNDPDVVTRIHRDYVLAGADVVTTNTFGANAHKMGAGNDIEIVVTAAVRCAKASGASYVALDVGPTGALLEPLGEMSFDEACALFREQIAAGAKAGADAVIIETMSDLLEMKAAIIAAKECCDLPVIASMTYSDGGRTFLGTDAVTATITLCALGVAAVGVNCSLGPDELLPIIGDILGYATVPVIVQANAGLPHVKNGVTTFPVTPEKYNEFAKTAIAMGVTILGGCCGTSPAYTALLRKTIDASEYKKHEIKPYTAFTGSRKTVILAGNSTAVIGERINPTGKKKLRQALLDRDYGYAVDEALNQEDRGADILDVNAGIPEIDEKEVLVALVKELQQATPLPLMIDTSNTAALEAAVRIYNGRPIINSVNGKPESLAAVLPIAVKYGAAVVALTLDDKGIPSTAEGRLHIAKRILGKALEYGMKKEDVLVDCLVLTASTNQEEVLETLKAVKLVKATLGVRTVLGVSNVSFGLPLRELVNSVFLASAFGAGLDLPILNPLSDEYMRVVSAYKVLNNEDTGAKAFMKEFAAGEMNTHKSESDVCGLIVGGRKDLIAEAIENALLTLSPADIISTLLVPALDIVGEKFENGVFYLPQLMASADTVKAGFEVLKKRLPPDSQTKESVVLATVKGDIHDIGKNIVKMMLENYGYRIIDLGKDVDPHIICDTVKVNNVKLAGLSALMTTTVVNMKKTIDLLHKECPQCLVMVGGAVMNEEYAKSIHADFFAKDAAQAVKIAKEVFG